MRFFVSKPLRKYFQRRRTRTISLNQFQLSSIAMMAGAFVVGSYFTLSQVLIPMIRALTETTTEMPVDVAFNRGVADILAGYDDGGGATYVLSSEVKLATNSSWWTTDYTKKKQLSLRNLGAVPLATQSATTQEITVNTKELFDAGALQANCEDLRVVFVATASANMRVEVPRSYSLASGATDCSDSTATTVTFPLQEALWANGGSDANYEIYYGNSGASQAQFPRTMGRSGSGSSSLTVPDSDSLSSTSMTLSYWVKWTGSFGWQQIGKYSTSNPDGLNEFKFQTLDDGRWYMRFNNSSPLFHQDWGQRLDTTRDKWHHISITYDAATSKLRIVQNFDRVLLNTTSTFSMNPTAYTFNVAAWGSDDYIDDIRLWNMALTDAQIQERAGVNINSSDSLYSHLTGYWRLDESSGNMATDHSLYHNNGTLNSGAWINGQVDAGYSVGSGLSKAAILVCPFNGTTTCVGGETPTTATGAIRYSGGKSALSFDGSDGVEVSDSSSLDIASDKFTVEAWVNYSSSTSVRMIVSKSDTYRISLIDGQLRFDLRLDSWARSVASSDIPAANTWFHIAGVYDGSTQYLFVNGVLKSSTSRFGDIVPNNTALTVGKEYGRSDYSYAGFIDEARVSNLARYTTNFTPQTTPFEPDANTKLLLHFDENGDDPRNTGKAIDSSGNGNHGTITGAKYVSGLVGVDSSTSQTGAIPASTFASHQGVFIEEGTTNKITNPSFEHSTYNTNWAQPVLFSLEDQFTTDRAAGAVNGSSAEPLGGTRTAINTSSKITISSGQLNFATGATVNDGVWYPAQARANGKVLVANITPSNTNGDVVFGWDNNQTGLINDAVKFAASGVLQVIPNGGTAITVGSYTATTYQVAGVLRSTGVYWFIKGGTYTKWTLLYTTTAGTGDGYPAIQAGSTTSVFTADNIRIPTTTWLPTPVAYDTFTRADGALGNTESTGPDGQVLTPLAWSGSTWGIVGNKIINTPNLGAELIANGSFESGNPPTGWSASGAMTTFERSGIRAQDGSYSARLVTSGNATAQQYPSITAGKWYVSTGYIYKTTANEYHNFGLPSFNYVYQPVGQWQRLVTVGRASSGQSMLFGPSTATESFYDNVSVKEIPLAELFSSISSAKKDVVVEANIALESTSQNHTYAGLVLRMDNQANPNNFLIATISGDGGNRWGTFHLQKYVSGTYTTLIAIDLVTAGTQYASNKKLSIVLNGADVRAYYDSKYLGAASVSDLGIINNTLHGGFSSWSADSFDNISILPVGSGGENNQLPSGMTVSENTTAPYFKFGSKAIRLENMADTSQQYATSLNPASTATHTLSAYVYDGTSGNVGGTVASSSAKLVFGGSEVTPASYTDMGGGWWRLSYSAATLSEDGLYGVQVLPGKTIYVDGVQLEAKAYATTYADGSLGSGYSWSGTEHESSGVRSASNLYYPVTSNLLTTEGTISFWAKPDWPSTMGGASRNYNTEFLGITGTTSQPAIYMNSGNSLYFAIKRNSASIIGATLAWTKGGWIHITGTWKDNGSGDVDEIKLYGNGVLLGTNSTADIPASWGSSLYVGSVSLGRYADSTMSDLRGFNKVLSAQEISNLYHSGLQTHTSSAEAVDRYPASGTYTSPIIDLGANGAWGSVPWSATNVLNGGGINYFTRTSMDNVNWSGWQAVTGSVGEGSWTGGIASDPRRYFQWKADLSSNSDQSQSPVISSMSTTYVEDSSPPANPSQVALGFANHASSSATLTTNEWYNFSKPKFTWEPGVDDPAEGQSSSGIDGYHVLLTTDQSATPSANLANPCYRFAESDDRIFSVGTSPAGCSLSDADYFLRMQTKDNSGNVADPVTLFTYRYDGTAPRSPASVSSTTVGYTSQNGFTFYWPPATEQGTHQSGISHYEYKTGATEGSLSTWQMSNLPGEELITLVNDITAYQEGQNFFFVRTVDFAGNVSAETSNLGVAPFYYNESAPTAPENLLITPVTTSDTPAAENIFTVTWDKPASYSGELAKYYYCVNCTPSVETMTETTSAQTTDRTLTNVALATQQGKNTFYLVAEDNNINPDTGKGNVNFEAYATADFYASTIAPGAPTNLTISDASDRDAEIWRLTLAWKQATTGGTPAHYNIYRSSDTETFTKIGETTSTAYTDADLTQSQDYSYKVFAIDNASSTSLSSNTVTLAPEGKYTTPPLAGGSPNVAAGSTVATITWSTGRIAYGAVEYGKSTDYEQSVAETVAVGNHSIRLTGLTPGTVYHYRVQALDDSILMGYDRENAYSADYTFTTSALPTISNVEVTDLTLASAIINWSAVSLASATIEYGESTAYGTSVSVGVGSEGTYSTKLSALTDSTTYHFRIRAVDIDGTDITSDDYTFTTLTFPKVTAVVFKTDQAQNATAINVAWSTNVPTTASVEYQAVKIDPTFASQSEINYSNSSVLQGLSQTELARLPVVPLGSPQYLDRSTISNRHVVQITNLSDSSLYVFTIRGRDEYGNQAVSDPIRYVTGADTKPPSVENLVIETPIVGEGVESKAEIVLSFTTDEPAFSQVLWGAGTGSEYPQATQTSSEATTDHMIVLRDLDPTSTYHLKIKTTDQTGNTSETEDTVVVTPTAQAAAFELILKNLEGIFGFLGLQ